MTTEEKVYRRKGDEIEKDTKMKRESEGWVRELGKIETKRVIDGKREKVRDMNIFTGICTIIYWVEISHPPLAI